MLEFEKKIHSPFTYFVNFFVMLLLTTLLTSCGGDEDNDTSVSGNNSSPGPRACGVTPSQTIDSEVERLNSEISSQTSDNEEVRIRTNTIGDNYTLGSFLKDGTFQRQLDVAAVTLPDIPIEGFSFSSSFSTNSSNTSDERASIQYMGFTFGARVAEQRGQSITFDSRSEFKNIRLKLLNNTQEIIDDNSTDAAIANEFVYGVYTADISTTISVVAQCDEVDQSEYQAAYSDFVEGGLNYSARQSDSVQGAIEITSNEPVAIAYLIRKFDSSIPTPRNLSASIENSPKIVLRWESLSSISQYRVYYGQSVDFNQDSSSDIIHTANVSDNSFDLSQGVRLGESWYFRVAAISGGIVGQLSTPLAVTVPISAPGDSDALFLKADAQANGNIKLSWNNPQGNAANGYTLSRRVSGTDAWVTLQEIQQGNNALSESFLKREFVDSNVSMGTSYDYQITWDNFLSPPSSPPSNIVTLTAPTPIVNNQDPVAVVANLQPVEENETVRLDATESFDLDNDTLSYQWIASSTNPINITIENNRSALASFIAPEIHDVSLRLDFELVVSDGKSSDRQLFTVTILDNVLTIPGNSRPNVVLSASPTEVLEGDIITLDASASSDADGDTLSFAWQQINNPGISTGINGKTGPVVEINAPFQIQEETVFQFLVSVFDGKTTVTDTVSVTVDKRGALNNGLVINAESLHGTLQANELDYWSVTVTNTSDFSRENVRVEGFYPWGPMQTLSSSNISDGGRCADYSCNTENELIQWSLGDLAPGDQRKIGLFTRAAESFNNQDSLVFNVRASDDFGDSPSVDSLEINLLNNRHLELSLAVDKTPVMPGEEVKYTITYGYSEPSNLAEDVEVVFEFPEDAIFNSASRSGIYQSTEQINRVVWSLGDLQRGDTGILEVVLALNESAVAGELIKTHAQIKDTNAQTTPSMANHVLQIVEDEPLILTLQTSDMPVQTNKPLEMFLSLSNPSSHNKENVSVRFFYNGDKFFNINDSLAFGGECYSSTCNGNEWLSWDIGTIEAGGSREYSFSTITRDTLSIGESINIASLLSYDGSSFLQRSPSLEVKDNLALELALSADHMPAEAGQNLKLTLDYIFNALSADAQNTVLELELPSGVTFTSANGDATLSQNIVHWPLGTLAPGASYGQRHVNLMVNNATNPGEQLKFKANIKDDKGRNALQTLAVAVVESKPLEIKITGGNTPINENEMQPIWLTVSNSSNFSRSDIEVHMAHQAQWLSFWESFLSPGGDCPSSSCDIPGEFITWKIDNLPANSSESFSFMPEIGSDQTDNTLQLRAQVNDASEHSAQAMANFTIVPSRGLELKAHSDKWPVKPLESFILSLVYGVKASDETLENPVLEIMLPSGVQAIAASDEGQLQAGVARWQLSSLTPGDSGMVTLSLRVAEDSAQLGKILAFTSKLSNTNALNTHGKYTTSHLNIPIEQNRPLELDIRLGTQTASPDTPIDIFLDVQNTSSFTRSDVVVRMRYPAEFADLSNSAIPDGACNSSYSCNSTGESVIWTIPSIAAGETRTVSISPTVLENIPEGTIIPLFTEARDISAKVLMHSNIRVSAP